MLNNTSFMFEWIFIIPVFFFFFLLYPGFRPLNRCNGCHDLRRCHVSTQRSCMPPPNIVYAEHMSVTGGPHRNQHVSAYGKRIGVSFSIQPHKWYLVTATEDPEEYPRDGYFVVDLHFLKPNQISSIN